MSSLLSFVFTVFYRSSFPQDVRSSLTRLYFIWQELYPTRCQVCSNSSLLCLTGALSHKMSGLLCLVYTLFVRSSIQQDVKSALFRFYFILQELIPTRCQVCSASSLIYLTGAHSHKMSSLLSFVFTLFYRSSFPQYVMSSLTRLYFIWQELYPTRCQVCSLSFILYLSGALSNKMSSLLSFVYTLFVWSSIQQDVRSALFRPYFICLELYPTRCQVCSLSFILYLSGALSNKMSGLLSFVYTLFVRSSIQQDVKSALFRLYFICLELYPTRCQVCSLSFILYLSGALSNKMSGLLSFVHTLFVWSSIQQDVKSALFRLYFICLELYPTRCQVCSLSFILYLSGALSNKMSGLLSFVYTLFVRSSIQQDVRSALFRPYFICLELYPTRCQVCSLSFILYLSGALSNKMSGLLSFVHTLFDRSSIQQDVRSALFRPYFICLELYPTRCQVCSLSFILYLTGALSNKMSSLLSFVYTLFDRSSIQQDVKSALFRPYFICLELYPTRCQVCSLSSILYLSGALSNKMSSLLSFVYTLFDRSTIQQDVKSALFRLYFIWQELIPTRCQVCSLSFILYLSGALSNKMSSLLSFVYTLFVWSSIQQDVKSALFRLYFICLELYPTRCQVCSLSFILYLSGALSNKMSGLLSFVHTLFVWSSIQQDVKSALFRLYFICLELYPTRCQVCSLSSILYLSGALSNKMSSLLSFVYTLFVWSSIQQDVRSALFRPYFIWQELYPTRCQVCSLSSILYLSGALSNKMSGLLSFVYTLFVRSSIQQDVKSALFRLYFICLELYPTRCQVCSLSFILYLSGALSNKMSGLLSFVHTLFVWSSFQQDVKSALFRLYFIWQEHYPTRCQVCSLSFILYLTGAHSHKMSSLLSFVYTLFVWSTIQQDVKSALFRLYFIWQELIPTRCQVCSLSFILYLTGAHSHKMSSLLSFVYTLFVWSSIPQDVKSALFRFYFILQELIPTICQVFSNSSLLYLTGALSHKMSSLLSFVFTLFYRSSFPQYVRSSLTRLYFIWQELIPTRCQVCSASSLLYLTGAHSHKMSGLL